MRFTKVLASPRMWIRMRGESWYRHKKKAIVEDVTFNRIIASGYNVIDANEYVKTMSPLHTDYDSLADLKGRFPEPPKDDPTNPNWHEEICKLCDENVFPIEGIEQALAFTKAVRVSSDLPESLLERAKSTQITDQEDEMARRIVRQAFITDAHLTKLPQLRDPDFPSLAPRRKRGTPWKRRNEILINNFLRLLEGKVPLNIPLERMVLPEEPFQVNLRRHGSLVQFRLSPISHILSTSLIKPNCGRLEVEDTKVLPLADIYPFASTANFEEVNVYTEDDHFAVKPSSKFPNIHTSVFSHHVPGSHTHLHPRWNDDRFAGSTILYNFATALIMARRKFGPNVEGDLPEPITTQVIHLTGKRFQFSVFQLNTLNLEDAATTSIKNQVWLTDKIELCSEATNYYGEERFYDYNPDILKLVTAMYLS